MFTPVGEGTRFGDILGRSDQYKSHDLIRLRLYMMHEWKLQLQTASVKGGPDGSKIYADNDVWNPAATALETKSEKQQYAN